MSYQAMIAKALGMDPQDSGLLSQIEERMRYDVFHSTLDWQTKREFNNGARKAYKMMQAEFLAHERDKRVSYPIAPGIAEFIKA